LRIFSIVQVREEISLHFVDELINNKCDFEAPGMCAFTDMSTGQFMWTQRKAGWIIGGQPLTDNTSGTQKGKYYFLSFDLNC